MVPIPLEHWLLIGANQQLYSNTHIGTLHKYAHSIKSLYLGMLFMVTNIFNLDENFRKRKGVFTVLFSVTVQ